MILFWDGGGDRLVVEADWCLVLVVSDGVYLDDCHFKRPSKWALDPVFAERLWKVSEEMVGEKFELEILKKDDRGRGKRSRL